MYAFDVSKIKNYEPIPMLLTAASIRNFYSERSMNPWNTDKFLTIIETTNMHVIWTSLGLQAIHRANHLAKL
jgi:hypothetical protein